ncbi:MAG TPA: serine/threonine-protein kinase [Solirubrobacterales bacterium]|nr:serine/threonine-protein kinase [Solirubrobacterales bacterium]
MSGAITSGVRLKDRYRLERTLGHGGMAAVWLGHDEVLDRPVAVKVLSDTIASDPGFLARFRREAQTAAGLSHPNLVRVYDFSDEGERPYLVMQFVPGENLASRLQRGKRIDCEQLARELLGALSHIHEVGILHRDIKPANIILEPNGTARLIDFGIALPRDATALTSTGMVLGTERYAAPEVMEGQPATERSDLYSCGLVLQACEGQGSGALGALIAAMTSKAPRDRPLSAEHALERLEQPDVAVEQPTEVWDPSLNRTERLPPTDDRSPPPTPPPYAHPRSGSDRRKVAAAILGLLAASTIVVLVALSGGDDSAGGGGQQPTQASEGKERGSAAEGAPESSQPAASDEGGSSSESAATRGTGAAPRPEAFGTGLERGSALNEQGFAMIQAGEYEAAVPVLEEAVSSFPEGTDEINYAYALFNLGNALRLSGRPEEAIPILERRLEIPNQEGEVRKELEAAYADAGEPTSFKED